MENDRLITMSTFFSSIARDLLLEVEKSYKSNNKVLDHILLALNSVFGKVLEKALDLIDTNSVVMIKYDSSVEQVRYIFQVTGSSGVVYNIFNEVNCCQCESYNQQVLELEVYATCKHVLAVKLAKIWKKYREIEVNTDIFVDILLSSFVGDKQEQL